MAMRARGRYHDDFDDLRHGDVVQFAVHHVGRTYGRHVAMEHYQEHTEQGSRYGILGIYGFGSLMIVSFPVSHIIDAA